MNKILFSVLIVFIINQGAALYTKRDSITYDTTTHNHTHDGSFLDITNSTFRPTVIVDKWPASFFDGVDYSKRREEIKKLAENGRRKRAISCNKRGVISFVVYYDDAFINRFGGQSQSEARVNEIVTQMQRFLDFETFSFTLNGEIIEGPRVEVLEIRHLEGVTLYIDGDVSAIYSFRDELYYDWTKPNANHYMLFTSQANAQGTVGLAFVGTTCYPDSLMHHRASVVEYFYNDELTGEIAAHEFGHSLGARHDFLSDGAPRYDSNNNTCTGIQGVMDYVNYPDKWTQCSMEDIEDTLSPYATNLCFPLESTCPPITSPATTPYPCSCQWQRNNFRENRTTENKRKWRKCCRRKARQFNVNCCAGCNRFC